MNRPGLSEGDKVSALVRRSQHIVLNREANRALITATYDFHVESLDSVSLVGDRKAVAGGSAAPNLRAVASAPPAPPAPPRPGTGRLGRGRSKSSSN